MAGQLKLSNVIGAPFRPFVREQLVARVVHGMTGGGLLPDGNRGSDLLRTSEEVLNLANQLAWVKLSSSVKATTEYINYIKNQFAAIGDGDAYLNEWTARGLARNWVLQGGTSKDIATQDFAAALFDQAVLGDVSGVANFQGRRTQTELREGIGYDGAYGLGGFRAQGYRPMPGITSVKIQSAGRLGSLRYATIDFKVWNRNQLDIIDTLYLRLGYTMLLEWGHTQYFERDTSTTLIRDNYGIDNFFLDGVSKEDIQYSINRNVIDSNGNYDGMLGLVTNFDCSFNQEGGWDCSIKLIGLGSIMESQKINLAYTMPPGVQTAWDRIKKKFKDDLIKEENLRVAAINRIGRQAYNSSRQGLAQARDAEVAKFATSPAGLVTGDTTNKIKSLFAAVRPQISFTFTNNLVPGLGGVNGNDKNFEGKITIQEPLDAPGGTTKNAAYYISGKAYLGHLGAKGYQNPVEKDASTIKIKRDILDRYVKKLVYSPLTDTGLFDATRQGEKTVNEVISSVTNIPGRGTSTFADLLYAELYNRITKLPLAGLGVPASLLSGTYLDKSVLDLTNLNPFSTPLRAQVDNYRFNYQWDITTPTLNPILVKKVSQEATLTGTNYGLSLNAGLEIKQKDGTDFPTDYKLPLSQWRIFLQAVQNALLATSEYEMDVTEVSDDLNNRSTYIIAKQKTPLTSNTTIDFQDGNGNMVTVQGFQARLIIATNILNVVSDVTNTAFPAPLGAGEPFVPEKPNYDNANLNVANMSLGLGSALEAMLTIIKYSSIVDADRSKGPVVEKDNTSITGEFLNYGSGSLPPMAPLFKRSGNNYVLDIDASKPLNTVAAYPFLSKLVGTTPNVNNVGEELLKDPTSLGVKGYATVLLQDYNKQPANNTTAAPSTPQQRWEDIPAVDFQGMMKSYLIKKHILSSAQDKPNYKNEYPVYIKLSYLLFFINNQSLLYDTTRKSKITSGVNLARPIFYIDYHPETNLCSTTPTQLSIDPEVGMIPFKGGAADYKKLFIQNVQPDGVIFLEKAPNVLSAGNSPFNKLFKGAYDNQAKTMDILLNIDYLLGVIKSTVDRDNHNNVYLQAFLERIVADLNKAFGDINAFRVAYNDAGNVVQILDDQYTPSLPNEDPSLFGLRNELLSKRELFVIPVFEEASIARSFTLQSDTSTKMSRAIAIGAQAANSGSVQSVDASSYHWLNNGLIDRFIEVKQNATLPTTQAVTTNATNTGGKSSKASAKAVSVPDQKDPNKILATKFNQHVVNIYSTGENIYRENVDSSRNFLMQGLTKAKAEDEATYGSLTIPYNATLTISGISGIMMGNAFLLPDKILPLSIRGTKDEIRFGFYVMGLEHTLDNNQWLTSIKGQIVRIREERKSTRAATSAAAGTTAAPTVVRNTRGLETTFVATNSGDAVAARAAVETYFGKPIMDEEWNDLVALLFAESGNTPEQRGYTAAAILNIANKNKESLTDSIRVVKRYEPVTGADGKTSSKSFVNGPPPASEALIYEALTTILPTVSKKINGFTAVNPNYYTSKKGLAWRAKLLGYANRGKGLILYNKNDKSNGTIFAEL